MTTYSSGAQAGYGVMILHIRGLDTPPGAAAPVTTYTYRAWDTGSEQYVQWASVGAPDTAPTTTTPQFTGTLAGVVEMGRVTA